MHRLRPLAALALTASLFTASGAHASVPKDFFGVVSEDVLAGDAAYRNTTLTEQSSLGIGLIRQTFHWKDIEIAPGLYNWSTYVPTWRPRRRTASRCCRSCSSRRPSGRP